MQVIPGSTSIDLAEELAEYADYSLLLPQFKTFSDGEQYLRIPEKPEKIVLIIQSLYSPQEFNLFQLLNLVSTVKRLGCEFVYLFVPYLCYARADREVFDGDAISAKTVINLIESVGTDHLITVDVHNPDIFKYAKNMKTSNLYPSKSIVAYFKKYVMNVAELEVVAPDEGAIDRAKWLATELETTSTNFVKTRDPKTNQVDVSLGSAKITSQRIILVDDIMSTGSSLIQAASLLTLKNINEIHVVVSHAMGTNAVDMLREIGNGIVASTISIPSPISKISTIEDLIDLLKTLGEEEK
jgi:ribose-phosphate pyrophosphokinase